MVLKPMDPKGLVDDVISRLSSRKLLVWGVSTWFLYYDKITPENWIWISAVYIGSQSATDIIATLKGKK